MRILSFVAATILCVGSTTFVQQQTANEVSPDIKANIQKLASA